LSNERFKRVRRRLNWFLASGTVLNFLSAAVIILPLVFARHNGRIKFRKSLVAEDETKAKFDVNAALRDALLFSRDCAVIAFPLLIFGTILLLYGMWA
jgi:hypothetical protein